MGTTMTQATRLKLTPEEYRFTKEYIKDMNPKAAAERAGFDEAIALETAIEFMGSVRIQEAAAQLIVDQHGKENRSTALTPRDMGITEPYVLFGIKRIAEEPPSQLNPNSTRLKAYELLGRHIGMFENKSKLEVKATVNGFDAATRASLMRQVNDRIYANTPLP
jgi:hypothetical protein